MSRKNTPKPEVRNYDPLGRGSEDREFMVKGMAPPDICLNPEEISRVAEVFGLIPDKEQGIYRTEGVIENGRYVRVEKRINLEE